MNVSVALPTIVSTVSGAHGTASNEGPTTVEMESALAQTERSWLSSLASQEERADHICHRATLQGDPGWVNTFLDRLAQVTPAQVRQVAEQWLVPEARAVVAYLRSEHEGASA